MTGTSKPSSGEWDNDDAARYHRPRRPVEVRRRTSWKQVVVSAARVLLATAAVVVGVGAGFFAYRFAATSPLFQVAGLDTIEVVGAQHVSPEIVRERFAVDVGGTILAVPLGVRRASLEEINWVEAATVQRVLPRTLRVYLRERTPVAFLRQGSTLWLIDAQGVLLPVPEGTSYSFPVLAGLAESLSPAERRARVQLYLELVADLDREGKAYSSQLSEIDLGEPDDVRASLAEADGVIWLHFGRGRYQEKFDSFLQNRPLWQGQGETVRSVDLRYRGQIVLNPDAPPEKPNP